MLLTASRKLPALAILFFISFASYGQMSVSFQGPSQNQTDISVDANINLGFGENVNQTSIDNGTPGVMSDDNIQIFGSLSGQIAGTYSGGGTMTITFDPTNDFRPGEKITVHVNDAVLSQTATPALPTFLEFYVEGGLATGSYPSYNVISGTASFLTIDIQLGDIDGDANLDLVTATSTGVYVAYGDGFGGFSAPTQETSNPAAFVELADFNLDGLLDMVVATESGNPYTVDIYLNDGVADPTIFPGSPSSSVNNPTGGINLFTGLGVADFTRDGVPDVIFGQQVGAGGVEIHEVQGSTGTFFSEAASATGDVTAGDFIIGDFDNNGTQDYIRPTPSGANNVNFNNSIGVGDPSFNATSTTISIEYGKAADFNGDGFLDLAYFQSSFLQVRPGNGTGNYSTSGYSAGNDSERLAVGDINGDGLLDIVTVGSSGTRRTFLNQGSLNFTVENLSTLSSASGVSLGDADNDGIVDAVYGVNNGSSADRISLGEPLPSSITVQNANDSGPGSLREAIAGVAPGGTILFDPSLDGVPIQLSSILDVRRDIIFDGEGQDIIFSGDADDSGTNNIGDSQIMSVDEGYNVSFIGITFEFGYVDGDIGGALAINAGSNVSLSQCIFRNNVAVNTNGAAAAIGVGLANIDIDRCVFENNTAFEGGGAIYLIANDNSTNTANIFNSTFINNTATNSGSFGGAIIISSGGSNTPNNTIATIYNCTFDSNSADGNGGALFLGNFTSIPANSNTFTLSNNTFHNNNSVTSNLGDAIYVGAESDVSLYNTIIASTENTAVSVDALGTISASSNNIIAQQPSTFGAINTVTLLPSDIINTTLVPGPYGSYLELSLSSPAFDAGTNAQVLQDILDIDGDFDTSENTPLDAAGNPREWDPTASTTGVVDIGAIESQVDLIPPTIISATTADTDLNGQIDLIRVIFSEDLDAGSVTDGAAEFTLDGGYTIASTAMNGSNEVDLTLNESGNPDTGQTPNLTLLAATLLDLGGASNEGDIVASVDGAGPVIISAITTEFALDGQIDGMNVELSEAIVDASSVFDGTTMTVNGSPTTSTQTGTPDDNFVIVQFDPNGMNTGQTPDLTLHASKLSDGTNTLASDQTFTGTTDGAPPIVIDAFTSDTDVNGNIDRVDVTISEDYDGGTLDPTDFTVSGSIVSNATQLAGSTLFLSLTEIGGPNTGTEPTLTLNASSLQDLAGNSIGSSQNSNVDDAAPPAWISGFPVVNNLSTTSFDYDVQLSEPGTAYLVVVPDGSTAPSVTEVIAGTGFGGTGEVASGNISVAMAETTYTLNATGLSAGMNYDVYLVAEDDEGVPNVQFINSFFDVATATPPLAPSNVLAYASSATDITLEWTDNATDETAYRIERADDYAFSTNVVTITSGVAANAETFVFAAGGGQSYFLRVTPINGNEDASSQSSVEFATTEAFSGHALSFDGDGDQVTATNPNLPTGNSAFTIEAWINPTSHAGTISEWGNYTTSEANGFRLGAGPTLIHYSFSNDLSVAVSDISGAWHHVAVTYDGTTRRLFLDGIQVGSDTPPALNVQLTDLIIGNQTGAVEQFDGQIDELKIWNISRSDFSDRFSPAQGNESGLVAYYPFDENTGVLSTTIDRSQNTNDGTLVGDTDFAPSTIFVDGVVNNTNDSGPGSLRAAIIYANATPSTTITFDIAGGGPYNIALATALPFVTANGTIIDGTTQPGWTFNDPNAMVIINATSVPSNNTGIRIDADNCEIYGLVITGTTGSLVSNPQNAAITINGGINAIIGASGAGNIIHGNDNSGIYVVGADNATILGNTIGFDPSGSQSSNSDHGIGTAGTVNGLTIGGDLAGEGNVISGAGSNRFGINIFGTVTSLVVEGNYVGTNASGLAPFGNDGGGINVGGATTFNIGGAGAGQGNVISGNLDNGIEVGSGASGSILNNIIGLGSDGSTVLGNSNYGILFANNAGNVLVDGNTISSNGIDGIYMGTGGSNLTINNNLIGLTTDGLVARGNTDDGVRVAVGDDMTITNNVIAANGSEGIAITGDQTNLDVSGNTIGLNINGEGDMVLDVDGITITSDNTFGNENGIVTNLIDGVSANNFITGNTISGNGNASQNNTGNVGIGIFINADTRALTVRDNIIGLEADGITPQKNINSGIYINGISNSVIGGTGLNESNLIGYNGDYGIEKSGSGLDDVQVYANAFICNEKGGINFTSTPDIDVPVITEVSPTVISGTTTLEDNSNIVIYEAEDGCNFDQGSLLVVDAVDAVSGGIWTVGGTFDTGKSYVALVIDDETAGDVTLGTSEFSLPAAISPSIVTNTNDSGPGSLREAINYANGNSPTTITFDIPGGGPYNIALATALPEITAAGTIIDGTTQPGWSFADINNMVEVDGGALASQTPGLVIISLVEMRRC